MDKTENQAKKCICLYDKITDIIFQKIPFENWKRPEFYNSGDGCTIFGNYECELGDIKIILKPSTTNQKPAFIINGFEIYGKGIGDLEYKLKENETELRHKKELEKLQELLEMVSLVEGE